MDIAERTKREDPWWYRTCPSCLPAEDADAVAFKERTRPRAGKSGPTGDPVLLKPREEGDPPGEQTDLLDGPQPTADEDTPF